MEKFSDIIARAAERKGGEANLMALAGEALPANEVSQLSSDRFLAAFSKQVFKAGFVWRVVEKKWPDFETVFFNFNIDKILMMPPDMLERKAQDPSIIRNFKKVHSIVENAMMIREIEDKGSPFGQFIADWPTDDIIGLWAYLKKHGTRLGGNTGPYALRVLGKDTFLLSQDVESYFRAYKAIEGGLNTKRSQTTIQNQFNQWQQETGLSYQQLSRILSFSVGDNFAGVVS